MFQLTISKDATPAILKRESRTPSSLMHILYTPRSPAPFIYAEVTRMFILIIVSAAAEA